MSPKRILYVVTQADECGGASKYVFDLAKTFAGQGLSIGVAAGMEKRGLFTQLLNLGNPQIEIFRLKYLKRSINPYYDFLALLELVKVIRKFNPDIVHLNSSKAGIIGTMAGRICRKKIVYTAHGFVFNENLSILIYLIYLWLEKICSWFRHKIITVSQYDFKSALEKKAIAAEKMMVVHNGIDQEKVNSLLGREEARAQIKHLIPQHELHDNFQDLTMVGTIANLYENKGLKYLIEAASIIIEDNPSAIFAVIGSGELKDKLEKLILDKKIRNNFFLLGKFQDAYKYLKAFDIYCLPSLKEGLSYSLLEALLAARPIIATDVGGNSEIVKDGINGFLVPAKDKIALAEKSKLLLKDEKLREKMGKESVNIAREFSLEKMVGETRKVYEEL